MIIDYIIKIVKMYVHRKKWRKKNPHNSTRAESFFDVDNVTVGHHSYGRLYIDNNDENCNLKVGNYVSIAENVTFLLGVEHRLDTISSFPFKDKIVKRQGKEAFGKGDIVVDDDVWIGFGSIILSGIHIGQGAVVAAGAVVATDVPPYAIVGGVPAKIIKFRFSTDIVNKLLRIDFESLSDEMIKEHEEELYNKMTDRTDLSWFPQK